MPENDVEFKLNCLAPNHDEHYLTALDIDRDNILEKPNSCPKEQELWWLWSELFSPLLGRSEGWVEKNGGGG